jgi:hypothetical protein
MKKVIKHMYSAGGHYIGSKEVPYWHTWISLPTICIAIISILIGLGIIIGLNGMPKSHNSQVNITNTLPF